jgi:hypothetical protein
MLIRKILDRLYIKDKKAGQIDDWMEGCELDNGCKLFIKDFVSNLQLVAIFVKLKKGEVYSLLKVICFLYYKHHINPRASWIPSPSLCLYTYSFYNYCITIAC